MKGSVMLAATSANAFANPESAVFSCGPMAGSGLVSRRSRSANRRLASVPPDSFPAVAA